MFGTLNPRRLHNRLDQLLALGKALREPNSQIMLRPATFAALFIKSDQLAMIRVATIPNRISCIEIRVRDAFRSVHIFALICLS